MCCETYTGMPGLLFSRRFGLSLPRRFGFSLFGDFANERHLGGGVGLPIEPEDIVKPHRRLAVGVRMLPGVPRQPGLRLSRDEAPVDGGDVVLSGDGQDRLKRTPARARHVLGAPDRAVIPL